MPEDILVTGATGYVAGWTIVELLTRGYHVRATLRDASREAAVRRTVGTQIDPGDRLSFAVADLTADDGWKAAMTGCDAVLHIASPLGGVAGEALITTAVSGTRRVLAAAVDAKVARVVVTSSTAACTPGTLPRPIDEDDWTDPDQPGLAVYRRSKVLAERAAWAFAKEHSLALSTLLPGAIFGPVLASDQKGSVSIIRELLRGRPPLLPRLGFNVTDVRDLAAMHVAALTKPQAIGERFIVLGEALWLRDVAAILRDRLGDRARKVPTIALPDWATRLIAKFDPHMRELLPLLGRTQKFSADKAKRVLGYAPRPLADTIAECGASLEV
jgi:nucleoside-diphosphate-sugar epimerase